MSIMSTYVYEFEQSSNPRAVKKLYVMKSLLLKEDVKLINKQYTDRLFLDFLNKWNAWISFSSLWILLQ